LRKAFEWTGAYEEAFSKLKIYLTSPSLLSRIVSEEVLYLYLTISPTTISTALIREDEGIQKPVYSVSKAFHSADERYPQIEKLAFALIMASRLANWVIELGRFNLEFIPQNAIKGQALADFLVEFTNMPEVEEPEMERKWVVYVDGSSTRKK
jgi:hypothetical protein